MDSSVVLCTDTPTEYSNEIVKSLMKNGLIKTMPDNMSCMIYIWTAGSFIPFHNDEFKDIKLAMTLFLEIQKKSRRLYMSGFLFMIFI